MKNSKQKHDFQQAREKSDKSCNLRLNSDWTIKRDLLANQLCSYEHIARSVLKQFHKICKKGLRESL